MATTDSQIYSSHCTLHIQSTAGHQTCKLLDGYRLQVCVFWLLFEDKHTTAMVRLDPRISCTSQACYP